MTALAVDEDQQLARPEAAQRRRLQKVPDAEASGRGELKLGTWTFSIWIRSTRPLC